MAANIYLLKTAYEYNTDSGNMELSDYSVLVFLQDQMKFAVKGIFDKCAGMDPGFIMGTNPDCVTTDTDELFMISGNAMNLPENKSGIYNLKWSVSAQKITKYNRAKKKLYVVTLEERTVSNEMSFTTESTVGCYFSKEEADSAMYKEVENIVKNRASAQDCVALPTNIKSNGKHQIVLKYKDCTKIYTQSVIVLDIDEFIEKMSITVEYLENC